jgi:hypothetical protein
MKRNTQDGYVLSTTGIPGLFLSTTSRPRVIDSTEEARLGQL